MNEVLPFDETDRDEEVGTAVSTAFVEESGSLQGASGPRLEPTSVGSATSATSFPAGASVTLTGLSSRADLEGVTVKVIAHSSAADERVAVRLPSGEQVRVKFQDVKPSFSAASDEGGKP